MVNLGKKALLDLVIPLGKHFLPTLATKAILSILDIYERQISGKGAVRAGKGSTIFTWNEDMYDIIKIVESIEKSVLLIDDATETAEHEVKNKKW